jgi:hypothetical protein
MMAYSSLLSVISTRRVRGTGCRARRPCLLLPGWLPLVMMMRAICYCSRCIQFLTALFTSRRLTRPGGFTGGHACCQCMSGPRPVQT